jgi:hypothetical protein
VNAPIRATHPLDCLDGRLLLRQIQNLQRLRFGDRLSQQVLGGLVRGHAGLPGVLQRLRVRRGQRPGQHRNHGDHQLCQESCQWTDRHLSLPSALMWINRTISARVERRRNEARQVNLQESTSGEGFEMVTSQAFLTCGTQQTLKPCLCTYGLERHAPNCHMKQDKVRYHS